MTKKPSDEATRAVARLDAMVEDLQALCGSVSLDDIDRLAHHERQLVLLIDGATSQYIEAKKKRAGG